jgi:hypothetical protein
VGKFHQAGLALLTLLTEPMNTTQKGWLFCHTSVKPPKSREPVALPEIRSTVCWMGILGVYVLLFLCPCFLPAPFWQRSAQERAQVWLLSLGFYPHQKFFEPSINLCHCYRVRTNIGSPIHFTLTSHLIPLFNNM